MKKFEIDQNLIEACVKFYGEKYREYITERINRMVAVNIKDKNCTSFIQSLHLKNEKNILDVFNSFGFLLGWELGGVIGQYTVGISQNDKPVGLYLYNNLLDDRVLIHEVNHYLSTHMIEAKNDYYLTSIGIEQRIEYYDKQNTNVQRENLFDEKRRWLNELMNEWCTFIIEKNYEPKKKYIDFKDDKTIYTDSLLFVHEIFGCLTNEIKDTYINGNYNAIQNKLGEKHYRTLLECSVKIKNLCEDYFMRRLY